MGRRIERVGREKREWGGRRERELLTTRQKIVIYMVE